MYPPFRRVSLLGMVAVLSLCFAILAQTALAQVPTPAHVVVVIEENHGYSQIIGSSQAPYINTLATQGALFIKSYALTHPSQPNYLGLFSGSTQGITDDSCPHTFSAQSLESELIAARKTFVGYPRGCPPLVQPSVHQGYTRESTLRGRTSPRTTAVIISPSPASLPVSQNYRRLHGWFQIWMMTCTTEPSSKQDSWLQTNLMAYVTWAKNNNSLLIVQWDEDQGTTSNHIATIFVGPMGKPGKYSETINHYNILRTIEDMYGLAHLGSSAGAKPITDVWK